MQLEPSSFSVKTEGDLPLYKTNQFEKALQEYIQATIPRREKALLAKLSQVEREILSSFSY